jgi:hypothetical protein
MGASSAPKVPTASRARRGRRSIEGPSASVTVVPLGDGRGCTVNSQIRLAVAAARTTAPAAMARGPAARLTRSRTPGPTSSATPTTRSATKAGPRARAEARTAPLAASAAQIQRGAGSLRASRSRASEKQTALAISGPLGDSTEETNTTIGVTATTSPSSDAPGALGLQSTQTAAISSPTATTRFAARPARTPVPGASAVRMASPAGT